MCKETCLPSVCHLTALKVLVIKAVEKIKMCEASEKIEMKSAEDRPGCWKVLFACLVGNTVLGGMLARLGNEACALTNSRSLNINDFSSNS